MRELIEFIARALVDNPTRVQVSQTSYGDKTDLRLRVAKEDMGRVIGKNGKVANAIRILLMVTAARRGKKAWLDIEEPR